MRAPLRAGVYVAAGLAGELAWTALRGRPRTSPWMVPVYALGLPLFEPAHERLRTYPRWLRVAAWSAGFTAVEYGSGRLLRALRGSAPWDYAHARGNLHGLVRPSYLPVWAVVGLLWERLHDMIRPG